ncbi:PfkB family carbohydrate kinase [Agromyces sp. SYSU T0242]|uniref:PfkB family carbohydrate kinase n=1 Tax=Agromyces litoreus TaxID=3158561 RepID=UPI003391FBA9
MSRVVVVGSLNVDTTSYVDAFPRPGETVRSTGHLVALGGKGANQAIAAHRCGAQVVFVGRVGEDAAADVARATLSRSGLADDAVETVPGTPTGVAQITVAASGENTIVTTAGANAALDAAAITAERHRLADADVVLTQGELPAPAIEALASACVEEGPRLVLNLAPPVPLDAGALAVADPLVVNAHEARDAGVGRDLPDAAPLDDWRAAAASATGALARSIVVTLGAAGAVAADASGAWSVPAPRVEAVDTTGAGDAAAGALAAMLAEGRTLREAVRVAVAAGAIAVQGRGTIDSYGDRDAVLALAADAEGPS